MPESQSAAASTRAPRLAPAIRTWLRYLIPLTALSAIALSPWVVVALRTTAPTDQAGVIPRVTLGWEMLSIAWLGQLVLVGGASAITRAPASQLRAFTGGVAQQVRAILPCLAAAIAIAIGCLALVVPGLVLLVLLSVTGASRERGLPAPLLDSLTVARKHLPAVALTVAGMLALDAAIGLIAYRMYISPLPRHATPVQLVAALQFVHAIALALVVASPLPATVLAAIRTAAGTAPDVSETDSRS